MTLPEGFSEHPCLELSTRFWLHLKIQKHLLYFDNYSSRQLWQYHEKVQERAEHSTYYYQGEELDKKA